MSFYATIGGTIGYARPTDFETVVGTLQNDGWLDEEHYLVDETGNRLTEEGPNVDVETRTIEFPTAGYRNLAGVLPQLFAGGAGKVVWTSTDGCFEGGVIVDGVETAYDLDTWNLAEGGDAAPDLETEFDEYIEWQEEIQAAFFEEFAN